MRSYFDLKTLHYRLKLLSSTLMCFFFNMLNVTFQIKATGLYLCVLLFTTLYRVGIPLCITIKVKSFHAIIFIVLYKAI